MTSDPPVVFPSVLILDLGHDVSDEICARLLNRHQHLVPIPIHGSLFDALASIFFQDGPNISYDPQELLPEAAAVHQGDFISLLSTLVHSCSPFWLAKSLVQFIASDPFSLSSILWGDFDLLKSRSIFEELLQKNDIDHKIICGHGSFWSNPTLKIDQNGDLDSIVEAVEKILSTSQKVNLDVTTPDSK